MVDQQTVLAKIWPIVHKLIQATLAEDIDALSRLLVPRQSAAEMLDLFGLGVFEILLKIIFQREQIGLTRAIETEQGQQVYIEFAWLDPDSENAAFGQADVVTVQLKRYRQDWRVITINPAGADNPMTEARAQAILLAGQRFQQLDNEARDPLILPIALFAGALELPIRPEALRDPVELLFIPGLQERRFGVISLIGARRLWRDFHSKAKPVTLEPTVWAAAIEALMSELAKRDISQARVGKYYRVDLKALLPAMSQIRQSLKIQSLDPRYSPYGQIQIQLQAEVSEQ